MRAIICLWHDWCSSTISDVLERRVKAACRESENRGDGHVRTLNGEILFTLVGDSLPTRMCDLQLKPEHSSVYKEFVIGAKTYSQHSNYQITKECPGVTLIFRTDYRVGRSNSICEVTSEFVLPKTGYSQWSPEEQEDLSVFLNICVRNGLPVRLWKEKTIDPDKDYQSDRHYFPYNGCWVFFLNTDKSICVPKKVTNLCNRVHVTLYKGGPASLSFETMTEEHPTEELK